MKKLAVTLTTFCTSAALYALPVGAPEDPRLLSHGVFIDPPCSLYSGRLGFYGDYVFNRHLEVDESDLDKQIEETELYTNAAYIALDLWDCLEIFSTLGGTSFSLYTNFSAFSPGSGFSIHSEHIELDTKTGFSWSIGVRALLWSCGAWTLGAEAQYFTASPEIRQIVVSSSYAIYPSGIEWKYREWQVGVGVSYSFFGIAFPYAAVKVAHSRVILDEALLFFNEDVTLGITLHDLQSSKLCGCALGVNFLICKNALVGIEGRFGDETACYINGTLRF